MEIQRQIRKSFKIKPVLDLHDFYRFDFVGFSMILKENDLPDDIIQSLGEVS